MWLFYMLFCVLVDTVISRDGVNKVFCILEFFRELNVLHVNLYMMVPLTELYLLIPFSWCFMVSLPCPYFRVTAVSKSLTENFEFLSIIFKGHN